MLRYEKIDVLSQSYPSNGLPCRSKVRYDIKMVRFSDTPSTAHPSGAAFHEEGSAHAHLPYRLVRNAMDSPGVHEGRLVYCHWHESCEWLLVKEGRIHVEIAGEQRLLLTGQAAFVNCGEVHRAWAESGKSACVMAFVFDPGMIGGTSERIRRQLVEPLLQGERGFPRWLSADFSWQRTLLDHMNHMCNRLSPQPEPMLADELAVYAMLMGMLFTIEEADAWTYQKAPVGKSRHHMRQVLQHIESHLHEKLAAKELARLAFVSEKHFFRVFQDVTGIPPGAYIQSRRISRAERLLSRTELPVGIVAGQVGFDSTSRFIQVFRLVKGTTPARFRKRNRMAPH